MRTVLQSVMLLPALSILQPGCRPFGSEEARIDPDSIEVEVGTAGFFDEKRWNRVRVSARAAEGNFQGEIEISGLLGDGSSAPERFRAPFDVSSVKQTVELPVRPLGWSEMVVRFEGPGRALSRRVSLGSGDDSHLRILGIGRGSSSVETLGPFAEALLNERPPKGSHPVPGERMVSAGSTSPANAPTHFLGHDVADLVVLDRTSLSDIDSDRLEALGEWVRRGGVLAAVPAPGWSGGVPDPLLRLLGLASAPRPQPEPVGGGVAFTDGTHYSVEPAPGAKLLHGGLLLGNRSGSGRTFLFTFSPRGGLFSVDPDAPTPPRLQEAWREVISRSRRRLGGLSSEAMAQIEPAAVRSLVWFSGFRYPPRSAVLLFVLFYLGVGFFLSGALFRRMKRFEWTYAAALGLAVVSSIAIYRFGLLSAVRGMSVDEVTVASVAAGSPIAQAVSVVGVASPGHRTRTPAFPAGVPGQVIPSQPAVEESSGTFSRRGMAGVKALPQTYRFAGGAIEPPSIRLYPNSTRFIRFDYPVDLGGAIDAELKGDLLLISNGTRHRLRLSVLKGGFIHHCGSIDPGREEVSLEGGESIPRLEGPDPSRPWMRPNDTPESAEKNLEALRSALHRSLEGSTLLIAESDGPLFPAGDLGPVRRSVVFFIQELEETGDR